MITLYLIRHLPTSSNMSGLFMGREDCDITDVIDYSRVDALRGYLQKVNSQCIFSSPLIRCKKTAMIVCPDSQIVIDDRLVEKDLGDWSGKSRESVQAKFPEFFDKDGRLNMSLCPPNGEDYSAFTGRIMSFVNDMLFSNDGKRIVVFTHGGVIATILKRFSNTNLFNGDCIDTKSIDHLKAYTVSVEHPVDIFRN